MGAERIKGLLGCTHALGGDDPIACWPDNLVGLRLLGRCAGIEEAFGFEADEDVVVIVADVAVATDVRGRTVEEAGMVEELIEVAGANSA